MGCRALGRLLKEAPKSSSLVWTNWLGVSPCFVCVRVVCRGYVGLIETGIGINRPFERVLTARMDAMSPLLVYLRVHSRGVQPVDDLVARLCQWLGRLQLKSPAFIVIVTPGCRSRLELDGVVGTGWNEQCLWLVCLLLKF